MGGTGSTALLLLLSLGVACAASSSRGNCRIAFIQGDGVHTAHDTGDDVQRVATLGLPTGYSGGLAVDPVRGIVLWSEQHELRLAPLAGGGGGGGAAGPRVVYRSTAGRGSRTASRLIHGIAVQTVSHTVFVAVHDPHGGYRILALDYLEEEPQPNWQWCGLQSCGLPSTFPTGGGLATSMGKLFATASSGKRTPLQPNGGGALWACDTYTAALRGQRLPGLQGHLRENPAVDALNQVGVAGEVDGEMGHVAAAHDSNRVFFTATHQNHSVLYETDASGGVVRALSTELPPFRTWSRTEPEDGAAGPTVAHLHGLTFVVAGPSLEEWAFTETPSGLALAKRTLHAPEGGGDTHLGPVVSYCEGRQIGGIPGDAPSSLSSSSDEL